MKYRFNKSKCLDNLLPLGIGCVIAMVMWFVITNPSHFFTTLK